MAAEANAYALTAVSQAAEPFRRILGHVFGQRAGILTSGAWAVSQSGTPGMSVSVAAGAGLVKGSESSNQGHYFCQSLTATTISVDAADATNPRRDIVVARIHDAEYATGPTSAFSLEIIKGTAAASPADPTIPDNCLVLARLQVNASPDATIVTGDITDLRTSYTGQTRATTLGGLIVCTSTTHPTINLSIGVPMWEVDNKALYLYNGTTWDLVAAAATAWTTVTFTNSWVNYGATFANVAYRKIGDVVYLRGLAKSGTIGAGTPVFTLPSGFRPPTDLVFAIASNDAFGRCTIAVAGTVAVPVGSNVFASFDGISFSTSS